MEVIGFVAAILIGFSLGLIGGGGSILTVPILVYFFKVDPVTAGTYSLFIVGLTSAAGSFSHYKTGNVNFKTVFVFGIPSLTAVFLMRKFAMPEMPDHLFTMGSHPVTKSLLLMVTFSILMITASVSMIRKKDVPLRVDEKELPDYYQLSVFGVLVGMITGFIGVGGGFLIIPSLVILTGMSMKKAVGTSLMIISFSSLVGVTGDFFSNEPLNYLFLISFSGLAVAGIIGGTYLSRYISNGRLKPVFGWFVLLMGLFVLINTLYQQF